MCMQILNVWENANQQQTDQAKKQNTPDPKPRQEPKEPGEGNAAKRSKRKPYETKRICENSGIDKNNEPKTKHRKPTKRTQKAHKTMKAKKNKKEDKMQRKQRNHATQSSNGNKTVTR